MAKAKFVYVCQECGHTSVKWYGRCPSCETWNSLVMEPLESSPEKKVGQNSAGALPLPINQVSLSQVDRLKLGISELDGVLGGGLVPGSLVLLGGEPGIGKSTILLQVSLALANNHGPVLYVSGEESAPQVRLRAERLGTLSPNLWLLAETDLEAILTKAKEKDLKLLILDSIQSVYLPELTAAPGSVSQVRQGCAALMQYAKETGVAVILVGHVTKEGSLAGPRVLEHMVDTVLYFEGQKNNSFRLLRAAKNRFGSTNEIGIFEMLDTGLSPLTDPSLLFLSQRNQEVPGSVVCCVMQGTRPVLVEVQALTSPTTFGNSRRLASGLDYNRLLLIVAVLEKKLGLKLGTQDIYVNVAGGLKVEDPAADLAVAAAIVSSYKDRTVPANTLAMGEIGLTGEVRHISQLDRRLKEAEKFAFKEAVVPPDAKTTQKRAPDDLITWPSQYVDKALGLLGLLL